MRERDRFPAPSYRRHSSGQAVTTLWGKDLYLGSYGSEESFVRFRAVVRQYHGERQTVDDLCDAFLGHARVYYRRRDGSQTGEAKKFERSFFELRCIFGSTPASEFSLEALTEVRLAMIGRKLCRRVVNQRVGRVRRAFNWGAANGFAVAEAHASLATIEPLPAWRSLATEHPEVKPVPRETVVATLPHVSPTVRALIEVQYFGFMRPGEAVTMRPCDIEQRLDTWLYRPRRHKLEHRRRERVIPLGPQARAAIRHLMDRPPDMALFSPAESRSWWCVRRRTRSRSLANSAPFKGEPAPDPARRAPRTEFTTSTFAQAVAAGCRRGKIAHWHPHRMRHAAAMRIRSEVNLEGVAVALGHGDIASSLIYADRDLERAIRIAEELG